MIDRYLVTSLAVLLTLSTSCGSKDDAAAPNRGFRETLEEVARPSEKPDESLSEEPSDSYFCPAIGYIATLNASIFHLESVSQKLRVKAIGPDGQEVPPLPSSGEWSAFRKKADDSTVVYGYRQSSDFQVHQSGTHDYQFLLWDVTADKEIARTTVRSTFTPASCGPGNLDQSAPVEFTVKPVSPMPIDANMEVLPLDDGTVLVVDPKTSSGTKLGSSETWTDIVVVRELIFNLTNSRDRTKSGWMIEEQAADGKTRIGNFEESGMDRGPLLQTIPAHAVIGPGQREDFKVDSVHDTSSRIVYGKRVK